MDLGPVGSGGDSDEGGGARDAVVVVVLVRLGRQAVAVLEEEPNSTHSQQCRGFLTTYGGIK